MHESLDEIERYIISRVRDIREAKYVTQEELSLAIGKNIGFISQVEAPSKKAKYNIIHLNLIAMALGCSPKDFFPECPIIEQKYSNLKIAQPSKRKK
ncbi:MAG: helix-turn-helix domain-containing protein [Flagellimonas sp.]